MTAMLCSHDVIIFGLIVRGVTANQYKAVPSVHFHSVMKHFSADSSGLLDDDNAPTAHKRSLNGLKNTMNYVLCSSQSLDLNQPMGESRLAY